MAERVTQIQPPVRSTDPALLRLAAQGRACGVRLLREHLSGEWFAISSTDRETCYRLTALSCTCPGFMRHQHCQHLVLLLVRLGYLAETEPVECLDCQGRGFTFSFVNGWAPPYEVPCDICERTGTIDPLYLVEDELSAAASAA
jgi:hypothetical protein